MSWEEILSYKLTAGWIIHYIAIACQSTNKRTGLVCFAQVMYSFQIHESTCGLLSFAENKIRCLVGNFLEMGSRQVPDKKIILEFSSQALGRTVMTKEILRLLHCLYLSLEVSVLSNRAPWEASTTLQWKAGRDVRLHSMATVPVDWFLTRNRNPANGSTSKRTLWSVRAWFRPVITGSWQAAATFSTTCKCS